MTPKRKIEILADSLVTSILKTERNDFIDWFVDEGWDEFAICKALGIKKLSEDLAQSIAITSMRADAAKLVDCVAYHTDGQHVYADATKLAVLIKAMDAPKLSKEDIKQIKEDADA